MKFKVGDYFKVYSANKQNWFIYQYNGSKCKLIRSNFIHAFDVEEERSDPNDTSDWWHPPIKVTYLTTKLGKILYK